MAVFRVERNKGYTVMSNHHLRNKELSLKAKGLLSQMLSLPEDWDYTLKGLSIPFPTRAGISPRSRQNLPKPVSRRAVRKAALCLTPFSAAARRGQPQGSLTGII